MFTFSLQLIFSQIKPQLPVPSPPPLFPNPSRHLYLPHLCPKLFSIFEVAWPTLPREREIVTDGGLIQNARPSSLLRVASTALPLPLSHRPHHLSLTLFSPLVCCLHLSSPPLRTASVRGFFCLSLESSDYSRLQCFSSLLLIRFVSSCKRRDLQWPLMLSWGFG